MPFEAGPIVIVGMQRSGTSVVAQILNELGVSFGDPAQLAEADNSNAQGYWEHKVISWEARKFELSLSLANLGISPLPENWREYPRTPTLLQQFANTVQRELSEPISAWKDPDNSWMLPFIIAAMDAIGTRPRFVICLRDPRETMLSVLSRTGTKPEQTLLQWLRHNLCALDDSRRFSRAVVSFDAIYTSPEIVRNSLAERLGLPLAKTDSKVIDANLRHQASPELDLPSSLKKFVEPVQQVMLDPNGFYEGSYDQAIHDARTEFDSLCEMFNPSLPDTIIRVRGRGTNADIPHKILRTWENVSIPISGQPGDNLSLMLFTLPGNVWVRKANWVTATGTKRALLTKGAHSAYHNIDDLTCFEMAVGPDQLRTTVPRDGATSLELELFYEYSNIIAANNSSALASLLD